MLLVEDDAVIRELLVQVFVDLGWEYRDAVDAESALAALREGEGFDLLITDVGLPGLNGRLLAGAARTLRPHLPILFITGYAAGNEPPVPLVGERMRAGQALHPGSLRRPGAGATGRAAALAR